MAMPRPRGVEDHVAPLQRYRVVVDQGDGRSVGEPDPKGVGGVPVHGCVHARQEELDAGIEAVGGGGVGERRIDHQGHPTLGLGGIE